MKTSVSSKKLRKEISYYENTIKNYEKLGSIYLEKELKNIRNKILAVLSSIEHIIEAEIIFHISPNDWVINPKSTVLEKYVEPILNRLTFREKIEILNEYGFFPRNLKVQRSQ